MNSEVYFLRRTRPVLPGMHFDEKFRAAEFNTGNYFFEDAIEKHVSHVNSVFSFDDLPDGCHTLILSLSNFLNPISDYTTYCEEIERRGIEKVVMIGAGCQADDYDDEIILKEGTRRFAKILAERSSSIGVRGYYTASVLEKIGINNIEVIGCPTAFWTDGKPVRSVPNPVQRLAVHCTPTGYFRDKVGSLFKHGCKHRAAYLIQSERWMMPLIDATYEADRQAQRSDDHLAYYGRGIYDPSEIAQWLANFALVYFDMDEWISSMETFDFVYGSRFHGNMAAIHAGTPALNMPFDTRTRELCEYLNLPHIPFSHFDENLPPERLLEFACFDLFYKTLPGRQKSYRNFLEGNGLDTQNLDGPPISPKQDGLSARIGSVHQLSKDFEAGLMTDSEFTREIELRLRTERSLRDRKNVEAGRPIDE